MKKLVFIFLFLSVKLLAQNIPSHELSLYFDQPEVLKKAGVKNVLCLFKDSRNLMWIGTSNGLFRYDGTNVIYQRHKPADTSSIPGNTVNSITEDRQGNLWVGTSSGVACMNPYNFKCKVYRSELHNLEENFDNKILVGPSNEIWAGNSEGLFLLNKQTGRFEKVWHDVLKGKPVSPYISNLLYWKPDTLVLGTFNDLVLFNTKNYGFKRISPLNHDILVGPLLLDDLHRLWIGTWADGCFVSNSTLTDFQQYKWEKDKVTGVSNIVSSFAKTSLNKSCAIWICGEDNLIKISYENAEQKINFKKACAYRFGSNAQGSEAWKISKLWADNENYIWIGGVDVARFSAQKNFFETFSLKGSGSVNEIQPVQLNHQKFIAVSSWHGQTALMLINQQTKASSFIKTINASDNYGPNISNIAIDKFNRIWVSSLAGVYVLNDKLKVIHDLTKATDGDALSRRKTNGIFINHDTVWILCYRKGINLYDLNFHKLKSFAPNDNVGLDDNLFERIFKDKQGNIWLCGDAYFYKYLPATATFKKYDFSIEHTLYNPQDITEMQDGQLMIATNIGLIEFDPKTETHKFITSSLLEKEDAIASVTTDDNGDIWYVTAEHLVLYQPKLNKFTLFGEEDELKNNSLQLVRSINGKIYLAEPHILLAFDPDSLQEKENPPQLIVNAVQVNDSSYQFPNPVTELHLNYNQNKIYLEFDGITYTKPGQNQYAYRLAGLDKDWTFTNKNFVSYTNLSPGHYIFHVKAANYAGAWSKEYLINISITPPFWLTWWFIALSVIAISVVFFLIVRYISQRNLRERILRLEKGQAVEKERNRIARDMHDDLGSGLTKIAILSEVAKTQLQKKEEATVQLEKISYSSRELVDSLQDIIWVLNPKNDSLENLAAYVREYALKFFDGTEISIQFHYPSFIPSIKLSEEERRNIFLVIKESLNNIAKHADCEGIQFTLEVLKHQFQITIEDDGRGFDISSLRHFANGLSNMKMRMEQINGQYKIQSLPGKGAVTTVMLSIDVENNNTSR